ncbi:hypothetical protein RNZ50_23945 [Paracoccaceae bacterium Fryx2]|nr:hypothetical protein [Paracoccaceae bacterium Fryx2]
MITELQKVEAARVLAQQLIAEGHTRQFPIATSLFAVKIMLEKRGIPLPDDYLAWISGGVVSDAMIGNPHSVDGR